MNDLVSIIVPVYNVEKYVDECLKSISKQTYTNIEVILVMGDSKDNSDEICQNWVNVDKRFRMIKEKEPGLGPARNQGVKEAKGKYVAFVDSDDYVSISFVEKLYNKIEEENADIVECDFYRIKANEEKMYYVSTTVVMNKELDCDDKLLVGNVTTWRIMFNRQFIMLNNITQVNLPAEDVISYPFIIYSSAKIAFVDEALYFYRIGRTDSLSKTEDYRKKNDLSADYMLKTMQEKKWFLKKDIIELYLLRWISRWLSPALNSMHYFDMKKSYMDVHDKYFNKLRIKQELNIGGFNLGRILIKLKLLEDPYYRFQFSSIISIMNNNVNHINIRHINSYRDMMINRDIGNQFLDVIKNEGFDCLFIDLIEERFDIIEYNGDYYTKSNAFDEADIKGEYDFRIIKRDSEKCNELWKKSFDKLIDAVMDKVGIDRVIVLENYLCENHGDGLTETPFDNIDEIKKVNLILRGYYQYIKERYPQITFVDAYKDEQYVTDDKYEYGCYPYHLNEMANLRIAKKVQKILDER